MDEGVGALFDRWANVRMRKLVRCLTEGHEAVFRPSREMECLARPPTFCMTQTSLKNIRNIGGLAGGDLHRAVQSFMELRADRTLFFSLGLCSVTR